jgi:hypothetical protein
VPVSDRNPAVDDDSEKIRCENSGHDDVRIQDRTKGRTSRSPEENLWMPSTMFQGMCTSEDGEAGLLWVARI